MDFFESKNFRDAIAIVRFRLEELTKRNVEAFDKPWYSKHFTMGGEHISDSFKTVLGESHMTLAASTINGRSQEPMRRSAGFTEMAQKMFTFGHGYTLEADQIRDMYIMSRVKTGVDLTNYIVDKLWMTVKKVVDGVYGRPDLMIIEMLFNDGQYTFTAANDPGSPFIGKTIGFGLPSENVGTVGSANAWTEANIANVNPFAEIMDVQQKTGKKFSTILMSQEKLLYILRCPQMKQLINTVQTVNKPLTETEVVNFFTSYGLPKIEIVNRHVAILQPDTTVRIYDPMERKYTDDPTYTGKCDKLVFVPSDNYGTIETQITDAQMGMKDKDVEYSYYNRVEVVRYEEGEKDSSSYRQITKGRLTAAPKIDNIVDFYTLDVSK